MSKELKDLVAEEKAQRTKEAAEEISATMDAVLGSEVRAKIPISTFKKELLPFIKGNKELEKDSTFFPAWNKIAGSVNKGIDLIDEKENVVATTPPLVGEVVIDSSKINGQDLNNEFLSLSNTNANLPFAKNKKISEIVNGISSCLETKKSDWDEFIEKIEDENTTKQTISKKEDKKPELEEEDENEEY